MSFSTTTKQLVRISLLVPCLLLIQPKQARADSELIKIVCLSVIGTITTSLLIKFYQYCGIFTEANHCAECNDPLDENCQDLSEDVQ